MQWCYGQCVERNRGGPRGYLVRHLTEPASRREHTVITRTARPPSSSRRCRAVQPPSARRRRRDAGASMPGSCDERLEAARRTEGGAGMDRRRPRHLRGVDNADGRGRRGASRTRRRTPEWRIAANERRRLAPKRDSCGRCWRTRVRALLDETLRAESLRDGAAGDAHGLQAARRRVRHQSAQRAGRVAQRTAVTALGGRITACDAAGSTGRRVSGLARPAARAARRAPVPARAASSTSSTEVN